MIPLEKFFSLIEDGDFEAVKEMLEEDPSLVNARSIDGMSAVLAAMYHEHPGIAQLMVAFGAQLNIFEAAAVGRLDLVRDILEESPELVDDIAPDGFQPLGLACYFDHKELAAYLLEQGASVDSASHNPMKVMPLHSAVAARSLGITRLLLEYNAPVNAPQADNFTPLHAAAQNGDIEIVQLLLDAGADLNPCDAEGKTPLDFARVKEHEEIIQLLTSKGASNQT
jgi:ankyrin repeat protein